MWYWRRMESDGQTKKSIDEVLRIVQEPRGLLKATDGSETMFGCLICYYSFFRNIVEGIIEGKTGRGKPGRSYLYQIKEKVDVLSELKLRALIRDYWRWLAIEASIRA